MDNTKNIDDLKEIKKKYGENMSKMCRRLFPEILDQPGKLYGILEQKLNPDKKLYNNITKRNSDEQFKSYIYSLIDIKEKEEIVTSKKPEELLNEVDYDIYKCETVEDLNKFKKYYKPNELLCTFRDGGNGSGRLRKNHIFFAVKKDVEQIKRGTKPRREDEYGVSVISIQISKESNWVSIKNRYNHTVDNPDATFSNNLDNIIPGLTESFNKEYELGIKKGFTNEIYLPNYIEAEDGKMYRYNMEINNRYYCPNNIVIDNGKARKFDKSKTRIIDQFIINKAGKPPTVTKIDEDDKDSFTDTIGEIKKVIEEKKKTKEGEEYIEIILLPKDENKSNIKIKVDESNRIIGYENENIIEIGDKFLYHNFDIRKMNLKNVKKVGNEFMYNNMDLKKLSMQKLEEVGDGFLYSASDLEELSISNLKK